MEILLVGIIVCQTYCYCFPFLGAQPTECSIKLPLSVCPSVSLAFFSGIAHYYFFFDIGIFALRSLSPVLLRFLRKISGQLFFWTYKKNFMLCIFLAELKAVIISTQSLPALPLIVVCNFYHKSYNRMNHVLYENIFIRQFIAHKIKSSHIVNTCV